ncbi:carboxypeptidase-like regulatory domain-containing protein [bacterium]|nr:carboxypeptidase-like regulatory domain-containing protein [bacterium]
MKHTLAFLVLGAAFLLSGCLMDDSGNDSGPDTYSVSGKILYESGSGIEGVLVTISGRTSDSGGSDIINVTVASDYRGNYVFKNIRNGSYTVTPAKGGFTFTPGSREATVNGMNVSVASITGYIKPETNGGGDNSGVYTVYGRIVDTGGNGMPDITVGLAGDTLSLSTVTDGNGAFSFRGIPNGTYTLSPGSEGFVFSPPFVKIIVRGNDVTIYNFIGRETEGGQGSGFAGSHTYYPMSSNAIWTIRAHETDLLDGYTYDYQFSRIVNGTKVINNIEYWMIVNDDDEFDSFVRIDSNTVYTFADFVNFGDLGVSTGKSAGLFPTLTKAASGNEPDPHVDELPLLRLDVNPGTTYDIMSWSNSEYGANFTLTWLGTYDGEEDITVTAGTFSGCRKYEIAYYAAAVGGGSTQIEITRTMLWLAPNVGIVKKSVEKSDSYKTTWKLEEELIGYSIP